MVLKMKYLSFTLIFSCISCTIRKPEKKETIKFKLKDGKEFSENFTYHNGIKGYPNTTHFGKILNEIKKGNLDNINKAINNSGRGSVLSFSMSKNINITRFLLENGADPNLTQAKNENYRPKPEKTNRQFDLETNIIKYRLPLSYLLYFSKEKNDEYYSKSILETALLLVYGAKINLKDYRGRSALDNWPKEEEGKEFATAVCKKILEEEKIYKFDLQFLDYAKSCFVDKKIIEKIEKKIEEDKANTKI